MYRPADFSCCNFKMLLMTVSFSLSPRVDRQCFVYLLLLIRLTNSPLAVLDSCWFFSFKSNFSYLFIQTSANRAMTSTQKRMYLLLLNPHPDPVESQGWPWSWSREPKPSSDFCTKQFSLLGVPFSGYIHRYLQPSSQPICRYFHLKKKSCILGMPAPSLSSHCSTLCPSRYAYSRHSCRWNHTTWGLPWPASFA